MTSAIPVGGDYNVLFGSAGAVTIRPSSSGTYTVTVKTPFKQYANSTCTLPATTVLGTFSGTSPTFTGLGLSYNITTCAIERTDIGLRVTLNSDGTLTTGGTNNQLSYFNELHLFTK